MSESVIREKNFQLSLEIYVKFLLLEIAKITKSRLLWEQSCFSQDNSNSNNSNNSDTHSY